jgi:hypothetical protein
MTTGRFMYHGSAVACGGRITDPTMEVLDAQAAAVVPIAGGRSSVRVDDYRFRDLISFRTAVSTVSGTESVRSGKRVFSTLATVSIEDLDIGSGVVTSDRVVARLVSEQTEGVDELPIQPVGSYFVNLRVAGVPLTPPAHSALFQGETLEGIGAACRGPQAAAGPPVEAGGKPLDLDGVMTPRKPAVGGAPGSYEERTVLTSLYQRPASLPVGCSAIGGWGIAVPGFGAVYLAELLITRFSRRLTMVRLELGSPQRGALIIADIGGNGSTYP